MVKNTVEKIIDEIAKLSPEEYGQLMAALTDHTGTDGTIDLKKIEQDRKSGITFSDDNSILLKYPEELESLCYEVPDGIVRIGCKAFANQKHLQNVILPETLQVIDSEAFYEAIKLQSIKLPDTLKAIGSGAFSYCPELADINIPRSIAKLESQMFSCCFALKKIIIPGNVKEIGDGCFEHSGLEDIRLEVGIESIGRDAFHGLEHIVSIKIPESVKSIGSSAFSSNHALTSIRLPERLDSLEKYALCCNSAMQEITLPASLRKITPRLFWQSGLVSIQIPDNVEEIEHNAFYEMKSLKKSDTSGFLAKNRNRCVP